MSSPVSAPSRSTVPRSRLLSRVTATPMPAVILVVAPTGYGKTTFIRQWAEATSGTAVWISLTKIHNRPDRFIRTLLAGLGEEPATGDEPDAILEAMADLAERAPGSMVVFDDVHRLENADVRKMMGEIIAELPQGLHLVLIGRAQPGFALARRTLLGDVLQISADHLAFTEDEVAEVAACYPSLDLDRETVRTLTERTRGWIAAVRLTLMSAESGTLVIDNTILDDLSRNMWLTRYISEDILAPMRPEVREFVLATAFLPHLTYALCNDILGIDTSAEILSHLWEQDLVTQCRTNTRHLVYQPLFAAASRRLANYTLPAERMVAVMQRAAAWFADEEQIETALNLALRAGDIPLAERLVRELCLPLAREDRSVKLDSWLRKLPIASIKANPDFAYWSMTSAFQRGRGQDFMPIFTDVVPVWEASGDPLLQGYASVQKGLLCTLNGDIDQALAHFHAALELLPSTCYLERLHAWARIFVQESARGNDEQANQALQGADACRAFLPEHQVTWWMEVQTYRAFILMLRGNPRRALEAYDYLDQVLPATFQTHHGMFSYLRASAYLELNDLERARDLISRSFDDFDHYPLDNWHSDALLLGAQIAHAQGDGEAAHRYLALSIEKAEQQGLRNQIDRCKALSASWSMEDGYILAAQAWAEYRDGWGCHWRQQFNHLNTAMVLLQLRITEGRYEDVLTLAQELLDEATATRRWVEAVQIAMWAVVASLGLDDEERALGFLNLALRHGRPGGLVRSFGTPGQDLRTFITRAAIDLQRDDAAYVVTLIGHGLWKGEDGEASAASQPDPAQVHGISPREMEVLRLVPLGLSNREIGEQLFISERTVKKHLTHLFGKLAVTSRVQLIGRAQELGLVD